MIIFQIIKQLKKIQVINKGEKNLLEMGKFRQNKIKSFIDNQIVLE